MKVLAITQARVASSRLPKKILKEINGVSLLSIHLNRILQSALITKLKVATTNEEGVQPIIDICNESGVGFYQGSLNNVLDRFYQTALSENPDWIVRLTSDCPLIDPLVIDKVIKAAIDSDVDYASNTLNPSYPDGMDVEVFKFLALKRAFEEAQLTSEKEHVTPYIWKNSDIKQGNIFKALSVENSEDFSSIRLTVDTIEDFEVIEKLIQIEGSSRGWLTYVDTLNENPKIKEINRTHMRNEGYDKSINLEKN